MKIVKRFAALALSMGLASSAFAAPGWTTPTVITNISGREMGLDIVTANIGSPMGCSLGWAFRLSTTAANYNVIASSLITAFAGGKTVKMWVTGCEASDGASTFIATIVDR
jgi:hypothetical protein